MGVAVIRGDGGGVEGHVPGLALGVGGIHQNRDHKDRFRTDPEPGSLRPGVGRVAALRGLSPGPVGGRLLCVLT